MLRTAIVPVWCVVIVCSIAISALDDPEDGSTSCTQIDFDEATLSSLRKCDYKQEFIAKRYDASNQFDPYRPEAVHYLSHRWQGLSCGETVNTYSFNEETELRMAYNLVFDSGALLEVRVFDEDRMDAENKPTLVEVWHTVTSTEGWGLFREKLNKTVKKARIQIEANINAGSDLAIEYLTIFNYEVETEECSNIDEFSTTVAAPSSSEAATITTTTIAAETTTQQQPVTTTPPLDTTVTLTTETFPSTVLSTDDDETTVTTEISTEETTIMTETTTVTATSSTTEILTTTTTNAPRDDTSVQPVTSTTQQSTTSYSTIPTTDSTKSTTMFSTTENGPSLVEPPSPNQWLWMTLAAVFAILFLLATSVAIYLCHIIRHLERTSTRLLDDVCQYPQRRIKR
ncbi:mucin-5AC-like [Anopheles moucheti]|uniref:mucin-5AC-like n=1 Tax=Anopheles moucheti TaxID=186751 RepID=UPI0022F0D8A3|nr:mucin-5AC-like [Anopheles moucheti]